MHKLNLTPEQIKQAQQAASEFYAMENRWEAFHLNKRLEEAQAAKAQQSGIPIPSLTPEQIKQERVIDQAQFPLIKELNYEKAKQIESNNKYGQPNTTNKGSK